MKKIYFIIIAVLFTTHSYSQQADYQSILSCMPPVPYNVLATNKEKEVYIDKISDIRALLSDYKSKFENIEEKKYTISEYESMENVFKEYESISEKYIHKFLENFLVESTDLDVKNNEKYLLLFKENMPYYEQIRVLISKSKNTENDKLIRNLQKKVYDSKLLLYPKLQKEMSDLLKYLFEELSSITQYVNKLDSMSLNIIKLPCEGHGYSMLNHYINLLDHTCTLYHLSSFEEYLEDGWNIDYTLIGFPM